MRNKFLFLACVVMCSISGTVAADATSDSLTRIDAETMVLKAREKQLEVQSNIISKQNEIAAKQNLGAQLAQIATAGAPVVRGIEGIGKTVFATLQLEDGDLVDVQTGDTLSNGMRILKVAANEVIVRTRKGVRMRLAAHVQRPAAFNPNVPGPGLRLPVPVSATRERTQ